MSEWRWVSGEGGGTDDVGAELHVEAVCGELVDGRAHHSPEDVWKLSLYIRWDEAWRPTRY